jgi:hypothetical protein
MFKELKQLTAAQVVVAIYNNCIAKGNGLLHSTPADMTEAEAERIINTQTRQDFLYLDYVNGRMIKVGLTLSADHHRVISIDDSLHIRDYSVDHIRKSLKMEYWVIGTPYE